MRRLALLLAGVAALVVAVANPHASAGPDDLAATIEKDGSAKRCQSLRVGALTAAGGCDLEVSVATAELSALTIFGDRLLGRCSLTYRMFVGPAGEIAITDVSMTTGATPASTICGDIGSCRRDLDDVAGIEKPPWTGRFVAEDSRTSAEIEACFDSCYGRFEGTLRLAAVATPKGLRMRADRAPVGVSGLELSGEWRVRPFYGGSLRLAGH